MNDGHAPHEMQLLKCVHTAHVKDLFVSARKQAIDGYTKLIQTLRKDAHLSDRVYKAATGSSLIASSQITFLCLQCPNVSVSRQQHRKEHKFCRYTFSKMCGMARPSVCKSR